MAIARKDMLVALIRSLDRSEKRYFTSHYQRRGAGEENDMFYRLFAHISNGGDPADPSFQHKIGIHNPAGIANLQRHLYGQLLESLRRQHRQKADTIAIREWIDYATLLYDRGLYLQSLALLNKAKDRSRALHLDLHHLLIVEFEKLIESRHITRAPTQRMEELRKESQERQRILAATIVLSNLQLELQRYFIDHGHVVDAKGVLLFQAQYREKLLLSKGASATFRERIGILRGRFWYHYNLLELPAAADCATAWVQTFKANAAVQQLDVNLYLKGLDRCLTLSFFRDAKLEHQGQYCFLQKVMDDLPKTRQAKNTRQLGDFLLLRARLNQALLDLDGALAEEHAELARQIANTSGVDRHKQHVLYYKLAVLCVCANRQELAVDYLNLILNDHKPLRIDLMVYTRLLFLCCQYRINNQELLGYGINNLSRYLGRVNYPSAYPRLALSLLRDLRKRIPPAKAIQDFRTAVSASCNPRFDLREFRFLDVASVLE